MTPRVHDMNIRISRHTQNQKLYVVCNTLKRSLNNEDNNLSYMYIHYYLAENVTFMWQIPFFCSENVTSFCPHTFGMKVFIKDFRSI